MHFIGWLEEQDDLAITKAIITDYNNGCLGPVHNISQLREHFVKRHPITGPRMVKLLDEAVAAYRDSTQDM